jgi:hypothetical protein
MNDFELLAESGNITAWYAEGLYHVAVGDKVKTFERALDSASYFADVLCKTEQGFFNSPWALQ